MTSPALGTVLRSLIERLDRDVEAAYVADGLDFRPRFTPVIRVLDEFGALRIKDIARTAGLSHSAASQTVSELLSRGWVHLAPGEDARSRVVSLTETAHALLPRLKLHWQAAAAAARSLEDELGAPLEDLVRRALAALDERSFGDRIAGARTQAGGDP